MSATINNFNLVGAQLAPTLEYDGGNALTFLEYSDDFSTVLTSSRWENNHGASNTVLLGPQQLQQQATSELIQLLLVPDLGQNNRITFSLDTSTNTSTDSLHYARIQSSSVDYLDFGVRVVGGSKEYYVTLSRDGYPSITEALTTTDTVHTLIVTIYLGTLYVHLNTLGTIFFSSQATWMYSPLHLSLNTEETAGGVATTLWNSTSFDQNYASSGYWKSPLLDNTQVAFWREVELTSATIPTNLDVFLKFRTTDDSTPGLLDYSPYTIVKFAGSPLIADLTNLVPSRRYYQFEVVVQPANIVGYSTKPQVDFFVADGVSDTFDLSFAPIDDKLTVYEQGLTQTLSGFEYTRNHNLVTFTSGPPPADTNITFEYPTLDV